MAVPGFYRRVLPSPPAISYASPEGKSIFKEALLQGTMEGFFTLSSCFQTQAEPAYCGLATLSVVLNALTIDPGRTWKGPWRWFDEGMLDCCEPLEHVQREGIVFPKVACLARCNGALVRESRADRSSEAEFRASLDHVSRSGERHLLVSYTRKTFGQTGDGHFSPIGGYHKGRDLVLILDVARFKYPPHWVPIPLLWESMLAIDSSTGKPRGFMVVSRREEGPTMLFTLSCQDSRWEAMADYLKRRVPHILESQQFDSAEAVVRRLIALLPGPAASLVAVLAELYWEDLCHHCENSTDTSHLFLRSSILTQLRSLKLHSLVLQHAPAPSLPSPPPSRHFITFDHGTPNSNSAAAESIPSTDLSQSKYTSDSTSPSSALVPVVPASTSAEPDRSRVSVSAERDRLGVSGSAERDGPGVGASARSGEREGERETSTQKQACCGGSGREKNEEPALKRPGEGDLLTVLTLACPPDTWDRVKPPGVAAALRQLVDVEKFKPGLRMEVIQLRNQLLQLQPGPIEILGNL